MSKIVPSDQLVILEAMAIGYALASPDNARKVMEVVPARSWHGPFASVASMMPSTSVRAPLGDILGVEFDSSKATIFQALDLLKAAEHKRLTANMTELLIGACKRAMSGQATEDDKKIMHDIHAFMEKRRVEKETASATSVAKSAGKPSGSGNATGSAVPKAGTVADPNGNSKGTQANAF